jgi:teichuronic acid biosynthesis glycosyltransferase TuaH
MGRRRRILYLMHVDWRWIKQRPQFLAEGLAEEHDVLVLHRFCLTGRRLLAGDEARLPVRPLLPVPTGRKGLRWLTTPLQRKWVRFAAHDFDPDIVWITHPTLIETLPSRLMTLPLIYDCMDDAFSFSATQNRISLLRELEELLVERSVSILCSSDCLRRLLINRYGPGISTKLSLVRNGFSTEMTADVSDTSTAKTARPANSRCSVAYFGTIAEWFDFDLLLQCLAENESVDFHLIGPVLLQRPPQHERLRYHAAVPHQQLSDVVAQFDAYMMPFHASPLIQSVDPVKLYEYLALGKEVVSICYPEIERFGDYVHFYRTRSDFIRIIGALTTGQLSTKNSHGESYAFLGCNSWRSRLGFINQLLQTLPSASA